MNRNQLRRRFSFAFPAAVFLSFAVLETVEVETVAETLAAIGVEDAQSVAPAPAGQLEKVLYCPKPVCRDTETCRRPTDA